MEKISGILPSSPRIKAVDLEHSHPVRKGVPSFGRKVAGSDSGSKVTMTTLARQEMQKKLNDFRPREIDSEQIPVRVAEAFFIGTSPAKEMNPPKWNDTETYYKSKNYTAEATSQEPSSEVAPEYISLYA